MTRIAIALLVFGSLTLAAEDAGLGRAIDSYVASTTESGLPGAVTQRMPNLQRPVLGTVPPLNVDKWQFGLAIAVWYPGVSATVATGGAPYRLAAIGIEDQEPGGLVQFYASKGKWSIGLESYSLRWNTNQFVLQQSVTNGGVTYANGEIIDSQFQRDSVGLFGGYTAVYAERFELTVWGGVEYWWFINRIIGQTNGLSRIQENFAVPFLGVSAMGKFGDFFAVASINGYYWDGDGRKTEAFRADIGVGWFFYERWAVWVGYSIQDIDHTGKDVSFDGNMQGFLVGVVITF